jgi:hypothetical protein
MDHARSTNTCATRLYNPLPTISFIIALNGCTRTQNRDSKLLKGKTPDGIAWPGQVTDVLTPAEINQGFTNLDLTIPPLRHILLDRGYKIEQIDSQKIKVVLFQVYRHGLDSSFKQIWDWAFTDKPVKPPLNSAQPKLNRISYDDMSGSNCLVRTGDRGFLEVSSSTLLLSGSSPSKSINLFCPELIQAGRPNAVFANQVDPLHSDVA